MPSTSRRVGPFAPLVALVVLAVGHAVLIFSRSYRPGGDWAFIELRTSDVFSTDTPLTGAWSRYGWNHPGPFLYDALALPWLLTGGSWRGLWLGAMVLNLLAIVVAWRVAARSSVLWAAVLVTAACWTIAAATPHLFTDPWNASVVILPLLTVAAGVAAVRSQHRVGVAVVLVVFVLAAQTHAAYGVLLMPSVLMVLFVGLRTWRRWTIGWLGAGAALCLPAVVDTLVNWPGNLWRAFRFTLTSDEPSVGLGQVARTIGRASSLEFFTDPRLPSFAAVVGDTPWGLVPFAAVVAAGAAWWIARRSGWTVWQHASEAVALLWLGGLLMTWRTRGPLLVWLTTWTVAVAALTWCLVAAVAAQWLLARRAATAGAGTGRPGHSEQGAMSGLVDPPAGAAPTAPTPASAVSASSMSTSAPPAQGGDGTGDERADDQGDGRAGRVATVERLPVLLAAAVALVLAVVNVAGSVGVAYPFQEFTPVVEQFADAARDEMDGPTPIDLAGPAYEAGAVQSALIAELEDGGGRPLGRPDQALQLGAHRVAATLDGRRLLVQAEPRSARPDGAVELSVWDPLPADERAEADRITDELTALLESVGLADRLPLLANQQAPLAAFDGPAAVTERRSDFERLGALHAAGARIVLYLIDPSAPSG